MARGIIVISGERVKGLIHETTYHLRRGNDIHGIFHRRTLEIAGARRELIEKSKKKELVKS
jgi:hypothetical protein